MGRGDFSSALLVILNIVHVVLGLAITAASIWFFIEVQNITSLRNQNHYRLDYKVYWPQAVPWIFMIAGVIVLFVSCCGFVGAKKKSRGMVLVFALFQTIAIVLLILAAILALVFADSQASDQFVSDAIWDAFGNMKHDRDVETAFGLIERKYQCCGAGNPRDYKTFRDTFPTSCCDTYYHGWQGAYPLDCDITTNKLANERLGCVEVASYYARIAVKVFSGVAVFTALIGMVSLAIGVSLSKILKDKPEVVVSRRELESKKVLL